MAIVDPLSQIFLRLERRNQPMHVGGLQLFERPADAPADYVHRLVERARDQCGVQPPFDKHLKYHFGQPFWVVDHDFDMAYHVRHLALPKPGRIRDLLALVSMLHGTLLDRARPLWEVYIIEGVSEDRFAVYTKFHHSMMDGVSAMRVMRRFLSIEANAESFRVPWQLPPARSARSSQLASTWHTVRASYRQLAALPATARSLVDAWHDARHDPDFTGPTQAPASMLNVPVSGSRRFAAQGYSKSRIHTVASAFDATINDVVLAMCSAALRRYLLDHDALPQAPLIAMLPVSLHDEDDGTGNKVGLMYANLATDVADPGDRLATIKRSVDYWKRHYKRMTPEQIMALVASLSAPAGLNLLTGLAPRHQSFNVIISNIPGPEDTLYFGDAEMVGMYPLSVVMDGQALNISLVSYRDSLEFGLTACRRSLPSVQNLLKYLDDGLEELMPAAPAASQ
ncbi:wax ester/triacylglycerol synthase family O-acyltransferase [Salinisphaera sp. SPP-AMP-43]|uniref:WS/DGAT/MGAT family O-acyltransferase n=1 Tax=Salinisphaera sp. SPP-AMP-43 TaxID=3121288 RepID=UPI003C6E5DA0